MGSWALHVEGHGIHDNGKPEDADAMLEEFINNLHKAGHTVNRASFTVGARRATMAPVAIPEGQHLIVNELQVGAGH